jgi:ACR3 family arsenite efflux pump ArsB
MASAAGSQSALAAWKSLATTYRKETSVQIKITDSFLLCTVLIGLIQFVYCALVGTFPFNSFLSGLIAAVGVFVLTGWFGTRARSATRENLFHGTAGLRTAQDAHTTCK